MNRRDALKAAGLLAGGAFLASSGILAGCRTDTRTVAGTRALSPSQQGLLDDIADTILPPTPSSPGAKAAGAGALANLILSDCYEESARRRAAAGVEAFRDACRERRGRDFSQLSRADREAFVREIGREAAQADAEAAAAAAAAAQREHDEAIAEGSRATLDTTARVHEPHYFGLLRELSLGAYWSSEIGMTQALRYVRVPGKFVGCMPLAPGQRAWA